MSDEAPKGEASKSAASESGTSGDGRNETGTVRSRLWRGGKLIEEDFPFEDISEHIRDEGSLVWVDLCEPDHKRLLSLADELSLDPLAVEDAMSHGERPKVTRYATHQFLTSYGVKLVDAGEDDAALGRTRLVKQRVSAFVLPHGIVTVRGSNFDMDEVVQRWDDNEDLIQYGVGALVHGLLDVIVDGHFIAVQSLDDAIEQLEDDLFDDDLPNGALQRSTYSLRKQLVELRRAVLPMREVVNAILRHRSDIHAPAELNSWYDDLYDHTLRAAEWTESLRDMVSTIFETNLSLQDARLNTTMRKLTSWAAIIAVPTAVTGFFGQNVPYPGYQSEGGFVFSLIVMVGLGFGLYLGFRRRNWL
ncbi:MAG: magnesium transporter [Jatrophihabitantaceae bacterium]|nr:magnesium transporter [Jatrophihabitantaceae bacterium]